MNIKEGEGGLGEMSYRREDKEKDLGTPELALVARRPKQKKVSQEKRKKGKKDDNTQYHH